MMAEPLDETYFRWLHDQVGFIGKKTYWKLFKALFRKEFVWIVPNDDNRLEDGRDLRYEFLEERTYLPPDLEWREMGCSMLEMLVALSRRLNFEKELSERRWFWEMMDNLELTQYYDSENFPAEKIDQTIEKLIYRTYEPDGRGGLFPLRNPVQDQRYVEIWYQLAAYLQESGG